MNTDRTTQTARRTEDERTSADVPAAQAPLSPQDFYQEAVQRSDIRTILEKLAKQ